MLYIKSYQTICFCIGILLLLSCNDAKDNSELIDQRDSLKAKLRLLTQELAKQNQSVDSVKLKSPASVEKGNKQQEPKQDIKKTKPRQEPVLTHPPTDNPVPDNRKLKGTVSENDTVKHFYSNKKISVLIYPLKEGKRKYLVFDQGGNVTYEMESIRLSYSQSIDLRFHENGSVRLAKINFNPGASMYWYETEITFNENNYPLKKIERQMPPSSAADDLNNRYFWNKDDKSWIKQEIIREYNTPNGLIQRE
jgi:hypothetical protein